MSSDLDFQYSISASTLRLRKRSPFFATLALFASVLPSREIETSATDGKHIFVNPDYLQTLSTAQQDELILHKVLHAALLHVPRRGARDPQLWNIAGDIVVNGLIAAVEQMELSDGAIRDKQLEQFSVEEVYELLERNKTELTLTERDLLDAPPDSSDETAPGGSESNAPATAHNAALEAYWRTAFQHANIISFSVAQGRLPGTLARELGPLNPAQLDWRAYLWRYLVQTPTDFQDYDRRFIGRGLYLDALTGQSVRVYVAVDTSGSIDDQQIRILVGEVQGILRAYPHLQCDLFYADARAHGPYPLTADSEIPPPIGGGGTDFRPFFEAVERHRDPYEQIVCVYLTDGFGDFPTQPPEAPVLWVVTAGGRDLARFPFGEAVRLIRPV